MRMKKYITLDQLIYWAETTPIFDFGGTNVNPGAQWIAVVNAIKPFLDGSMDNPYSTTNPKEKLPEYFSTTRAISDYLNGEYEDRLVAIPFRGGEYYPRFNRNLTKDEAMEVILQELIAKTNSFVSIYGYQFLKLFGTSSLTYDPRYSIQEHIRKVNDYGQHITTDNYGARQKTDKLGPTEQTNSYGGITTTDNLGATKQTNQYGAQSNSYSKGAQHQEVEYGNTSSSDQYGQIQETLNNDTEVTTTQYGATTTSQGFGPRTVTHSETTMNDLTFKPKAKDVTDAVNGDSTSVGAHSDTTTKDGTTDTKTTGSHTDTHTANSHTDITDIRAVQDSESKGTHTDTISGDAVTNSNQVSSHVDTLASAAVTNTSNEATHTDTNTSNSHQDVETTDREATGVKTIQELLSMERQLLDWNPALEFFKAYTNKILLSCYCY